MEAGGQHAVAARRRRAGLAWLLGAGLEVYSGVEGGSGGEVLARELEAAWSLGSVCWCDFG